MGEDKKLSDGKRTFLYLFSAVYLGFLYFVYSGYFGAKVALIVSISIPIIIFILGMMYFPNKNKQRKV